MLMSISPLAWDIFAKHTVEGGLANQRPDFAFRHSNLARDLGERGAAFERNRLQHVEVVDALLSGIIERLWTT